MADRNEIIRNRYSEILRKKIRAQEDLLKDLSEGHMEQCFEEISPLFGTLISESRIKTQLTRLINRLVGDV